jgi:hypothetical protein
MSRRGEPVKHTCPDIDRLIKTVTEIVAGMNFKEDTMEDTLSLMSDWKTELEKLRYMGLNLEHYQITL